MKIGDWAATVELNQTVRDARKLGIEQNLFELEAFGFTVIEPDQLNAKSLCDRMLAATLELSDEEDRANTVVRVPKQANSDPNTELSAADPDKPRNANDYNRMLYHLHARSPVFLEAFMHPVARNLARYMLGASCVISGSAAFVKRGNVPSTFLHVDSRGVPPPLYSFATGLNISWVLTDYTEEGGTFAFVPGSHRYCRHPSAGELPKVMGGTAPDICIPCEAKAGSLIVFGSNMWHGTYSKKTDELRVHVVTGFTRPHMVQFDRTDDIPQEFLAPYGDEIHRLLGSERWTGYGKEGPDPRKLVAALRVDTTPSG